MKTVFFSFYIAFTSVFIIISIVSKCFPSVASLELFSNNVTIQEQCSKDLLFYFIFHFRIFLLHFVLCV